MARRRRGDAPQYSPIPAFTTPEMASRGQYSGFGTNPNSIYSFRGQQITNPSTGTGQGMDMFGGLRGSLAYQQADPRGRQRMEQAVEMGLPANTDISRVQRTGMVDMDRRPIFAAPRPQPFGTFGSIGMNNDEEQPALLPRTPTMPSGGPQPAPRTAGISAGVAPTLSPRQSSYSGSAIEGTAYTPSAPNMGMGAYTPPITEQTPAFGLGGSSLTSPLTGLSPSLQFPSDMDKILNPYGLRNYY